MQLGCVLCKQVITQTKRWEAHVALVERGWAQKKKLERLPCSYCGKLFTSQEALDAHIESWTVSVKKPYITGHKEKK